jgi:hypothetical protein
MEDEKKGKDHQGAGTFFYLFPLNCKCRFDFLLHFCQLLPFYGLQTFVIFSLVPPTHSRFTTTSLSFSLSISLHLTVVLIERERDRPDKTRHCKRQDKTRQDDTRQGTRQDKTQDKRDSKICRNSSSVLVLSLLEGLRFLPAKASFGLPLSPLHIMVVYLGVIHLFLFYLMTVTTVH